MRVASNPSPLRFTLMNVTVLVVKIAKMSPNHRGDAKLFSLANKDANESLQCSWDVENQRWMDDRMRLRLPVGLSQALHNVVDTIEKRLA